MADTGSVFVAVPTETWLLHPRVLTSLLLITTWRLQEALQWSVMSCRVSTDNKYTGMCLYKVFAGVSGQARSYRSCVDEKKETNKHESSAADTPTRGQLYLLARCVGPVCVRSRGRAALWRQD